MFHFTDLKFGTAVDFGNVLDEFEGEGQQVEKRDIRIFIFIDPIWPVFFLSVMT